MTGSTDAEAAHDTDAAGEIPLRLVLVNAPPTDAPVIARALIERRLAACVNVVPGVQSFYRWQGRLEEDTESTLLIKTRAALVAAVTEAVRALHPYEVPEVICLPIDARAGNPAYLAWLASETT